MAQLEGSSPGGPVALIDVRYIHDATYVTDTVDQSVPAHPQVIAVYENSIIRIGRDPSTNEVVLDSMMVSRNHMEFYAIVFDGFELPPAIYVRDRRSANGTWVNGWRIGKAGAHTRGWLLKHGDVISIPGPDSRWKFALHQPEAAGRVQMISVHEDEEREILRGRLKIEITDRVLGGGAHGRAHLALDLSNNTQIVCKVTPIRWLGRNTADYQFRNMVQELDVLRQIDHPNILSFVAAARSQTAVYCFTELAAGGDLFSWMLRRTRPEEDEVRLIIRQVVRGVEHLHSVGVIHRDLKPENIYFATCPKAGHRVVIGDLGCVGIIPRARRRLISRVGTNSYYPPERSRSLLGEGAERNAYTKQGDMWALGITTLRLMLPDHAKDMSLELKYYAQTELDEWVNQQCSGLSANAKSFIRCCLRIRPLERISAGVALKHSWFCEPAEDLETFRRLDRDILRYWCPRRRVLPVVEELPDLLPDLGRRAFPAERQSHPKYRGDVKRGLGCGASKAGAGHVRKTQSMPVSSPTPSPAAVSGLLQTWPA